jgi:hypothetical protein
MLSHMRVQKKPGTIRSVRCWTFSSQSTATMADPDELYTLRAQYWLGHYQLALDEAKSIMRRPMSPALKAEREEYTLRCYLAMGQHDKVISASPDTPGT